MLAPSRRRSRDDLAQMSVASRGLDGLDEGLSERWVNRTMGQRPRCADGCFPIPRHDQLDWRTGEKRPGVVEVGVH